MLSHQPSGWEDDKIKDGLAWVIALHGENCEDGWVRVIIRNRAHCVVVVQVVFGAGDDSGTGIDIIGNITNVVNSFIGAGASLASIVALLIVMSVLSRKT